MLRKTLLKEISLPKLGDGAALTDRTDRGDGRGGSTFKISVRRSEASQSIILPPVGRDGSRDGAQSPIDVGRRVSSKEGTLISGLNA